jgi:UDP-N-acetylglucosamine--N-acetylmuramyl-(pentapeptide) pyrophosphoryl-undecaprenol N-acetylglucosamine transferase
VFHLLVFGGSLGAHAINEAMAAAAPLLAGWRGRLTVTHQTGDKDQETVAQAYREAGLETEVVTFIDDMAAAYRRADLVVCRAGATTIAEATACGKPCLFIPFPFAVDDHQRRNAEALLKKGACEMLLELELSGERLAATVGGLLREPERLAGMGRQARSLARLEAAKVIVDEMMKAGSRL